MNFQQPFRQTALYLGMGAAVVGGTFAGYKYNDVQNTQEQLGDKSKFRYSSTAKIKGIYIHHIAGDMTPQEVDVFHNKKFNGGGISYQLYFDDGTTQYVSPWDVLKAQAASQNTISRGFVFNGNYMTDKVEHRDVQQFEIMLYATLKVFPHIEWVRFHGDSPYSNTDCPGTNLRKALKDYTFESRGAMQKWLEKMDRRLLNPCMDARIFQPGFIDGEPC